ncbi:hypothetical protein [Lacinutrix chionoecetis]
MRTLKHSIKLFSILALSSITFTSCSSDDDNGGNNDTPQTASTRLYTSNNANGNITIYDVTDLSNVTGTTLITTSTMADGIHYDATADVVSQASRSGLSIEGFSNVSNLVSGTTVTVDISGTADMDNPREMAVKDNALYVVADNNDVDGQVATPDGRFFIYKKTANGFELKNTITTNIKVWGITFIGDDLYAIVDTTNELAVFTDFLSNETDVTLAASKTIAIDGLTRTHGITYDAQSNTAVLTDIGDAASSTDGGFHVISDFTTKFNATGDGGTLAVSDQVIVSGASTELGNPVDVAFDGTTQTVFIAEAENGKILAFNNIGAGGDIAPVLSNSLMSASAVYLYKE